MDLELFYKCGKRYDSKKVDLRGTPKLLYYFLEKEFDELILNKKIEINCENGYKNLFSVLIKSWDQNSFLKKDFRIDQIFSVLRKFVELFPKKSSNPHTMLSIL